MVEMTRLERYAWQPGPRLTYHQFFWGRGVQKIGREKKCALLVLFIQAMHLVEGASLFEVSIHLDRGPSMTTKFWL